MYPRVVQEEYPGVLPGYPALVYYRDTLPTTLSCVHPVPTAEHVHRRRQCGCVPGPGRTAWATLPYPGLGNSFFPDYPALSGHASSRESRG